jgi:hypothetical protein
MLVSPEALPQEAVEEQARLDLGLASHPFTVQAMHPPKGRHLHPFDWIDTPARLLASRPDTANAWPVVVARLHMHLGPRRTRRPAFRRVGWAGAVPFQRVDERAAGPEEPHRQPLRPACRCPGDRRVAARPEAARGAGLEGGVEKVVTSRNDRRIDRSAASGTSAVRTAGVRRRWPGCARPTTTTKSKSTLRLAQHGLRQLRMPGATSGGRRAVVDTAGHHADPGPSQPCGCRPTPRPRPHSRWTQQTPQRTDTGRWRPDSGHLDAQTPAPNTGHLDRPRGTPDARIGHWTPAARHQRGHGDDRTAGIRTSLATTRATAR